MAKPYKRGDSRFWWISPTVNGVQVPQSSKETEYDRALTKLRILEGKIAGNAAFTPYTDRGSFAALLQLVITDYTIKGRSSLPDTQRRIDKHLKPTLGHFQSGKMTSATIADYILQRKSTMAVDGLPVPASNASINRELAIIKRAFRLGIRSGEVSAVPYIEMLPEDNVRSGLFTEDGFRSLLKHANIVLRDVLTSLYYTGWRIESVLALEWRNVDFKRNLAGLRKEQTKNRKATAFPLAAFPELLAMLERRRASTDEVERRKSVIVPYVFHREGERVVSVRKAWEIARVKAGLPGRIIHDFRRTAVVNLEAAGWTETEIMSMVGLKTRSIFIRYNVSTEDRILSKAKRLLLESAQRKT